MPTDKHFQTKIFLKTSHCVWKQLLNGIAKFHREAYFEVWSAAHWSQREGMQKHTLLSLLWEVNFAANTCITLNTLQVSFILLVVKSMFKGDIFKNLPGFCFTEKHDWAMKEKKKMAMAKRASVTAKISNYPLLKARRSPDGFFSTWPKLKQGFCEVYPGFSQQQYLQIQSNAIPNENLEHTQ